MDDAYHNIFDKGLFTSTKHLEMKRCWIFQQDNNYLKHTANDTYREFVASS